MPQGDKRGVGWEFFDATYDGHWDGQLQRGLGQLIDGKVGPENFKMGYYDYERGLYFHQMKHKLEFRRESIRHSLSEILH